MNSYNATKYKSTLFLFTDMDNAIELKEKNNITMPLQK